MPTVRESLYCRHRFPAEVISHAVWLYFRFPLSLRMVEEMLAARGVCVTYETVRRWGKKFGKTFADQIRQRAPARGDKWHLDEVVVSIAGETALAVARSRPERLRSRSHRSTPQGHASGTAAHEEPPEIRPEAATRDDHGQASILRSRESEDRPSRRASPAQGAQQSAENSHQPTRRQADHETL